MPAANDHPRLHVVVTPEAYDGWTTFARNHGVTVAALVEAIGLQLGSVGERPPAILRDAVTLARQVAADRRSRRR